MEFKLAGLGFRRCTMEFKFAGLGFRRCTVEFKLAGLGFRRCVWSRNCTPICERAFAVAFGALSALLFSKSLAQFSVWFLTGRSANESWLQASQCTAVVSALWWQAVGQHATDCVHCSHHRVATSKATHQLLAKGGEWARTSFLVVDRGDGLHLSARCSSSGRCR